MLKINEIKNKLKEASERMKAISETEELSDELREEFDGLVEKRGSLNKDLSMAQEAERAAADIALMSIKDKEETEERDDSSNVFESFREYVNTGRVPKEFEGPEGGFMFRTDPLLTTTETGVIEKKIAPTSIVKSDGLEFPRSLGVNILTGLKGTVELPNMAQLDASVVSEGSSYVTGGAAPATIEMKGRTFGNSQGFSKQFLYTASPDLVSKIIGDMQAANGRKILADLFDNFSVDAVDASVAGTAAGLSYGDLVSLKAIDYKIGNTGFVTTPSIRAYLEQLNAASAGIKFVWDNNSVAGEKALATAAANSTEVYFGDWSQAVIGLWGTEVIVDPYSLKKSGKLELAANTYADTAIQNYRAFKWIPDASASI